MDTMTSDVSKPNEVMNLLQLSASDDGQSEMANNLELMNAALGNTENEGATILESQSTIELNGERHVIVQETQDPQTGELLLVLKSESGNHIALPSSVIQSGIQLAQENQLDALHQEGGGEEIEQQRSQEEQNEGIGENVSGESVVNGIPESNETVGVPVLEPQIQEPEVSQKLPEGTTVAIIDDGSVATQEAVGGQEMASSTVSLDAASLEALVANAMASGAMAGAADGQEFVIMTDGAPAVDAVSGAESVEVGGGDGAVYGEQVVENSSTQYVASNGSTEEMILNAMSQSGTLQDGQVIHAVVDNQTFAYTISATESGFQLIPMGPVIESPRSSPKKPSPVRNSKQRPAGETLLVASARMDSMTGSGFRRKPGVGRVGNKPNSYDNQRFMGRTPVIDSDSPSLLTATAPGPSQLASSRRTYSKKNVVWCNPESRSNKTTFVSMSNLPKATPRNAEPTTAVVPASQPSLQPSTVSSPLKVTPVPTPASPEKPKPVVRAASPEKPKPVVRAASPEKPKPVVRAASPAKMSQVEQPILIDDGKTLEEAAPQVIEMEIGPKSPADRPKSPTIRPKSPTNRPKSPAKKENGVAAKPAPKQPVEELVPKKAVGRPRKSVGKVVDNHEAEATKEEPKSPKKKIETPEATKEEPKSPKKKIETPEVVEEVPVVQEKERPSRTRKPTPKVAAIASKTPSKVEEKVSVPEEPSSIQSEVEPSVAGKVTPARAGRKKAVKQEEATPAKTEEKTGQIEKEKIEEKTAKKVEEKPTKKVEEKTAKKVEEKTAKKVEEKAVESKKEVEVQKGVSSEDEAGSSNVRRSSRPPKRKSIDDDIVFPERKVVSEKRTRVKEAEKNAEEEKQPEEKKAEEKKEVEGSATPRKRVGFSSEVSKRESSSQGPKRRRSGSTEKTPGKEESTPKKPDVKPILKRSPNSTPKGRRLETPIVATFSPTDSNAEKKLLKEVIDSLNDQRSPDQRYDIPTPGCEIHIRQQSVSLAGYTPRGSGSSYACQKCGFRTSRMNNLIIHHKEQCPVVKNAQMMSWKAEIRKQTKTPTSTVTRRTSELSPSSPEEEEGSPVPASSFTPYESPRATLSRPSDIDAPLSADEEDEALLLENKIRDKYGFAPKDIVWVEWKNTSWPALAISVDMKKGEVQARLIDGPERSSRRGIKVAVEKVAPFDDAEQNKRLLREGREGENGDLLVKAVQKAEEHLRKQCLGESNLVKVLGDLDADFSDGHSDDEDSRAAHCNAISGGNSPGIDTMDSLDDEAVFANAQTMDQWKERRRVQNAKLLQCVKEGKVETHLLGVYSGTIPSERHQKFRSGSDADKNPLSLAWFGPIDDEDQQEEIYEYCSQLFKSNFKPDGDFDTVAYLFEVWVPEAIMKAISRVRRLEMKEAEEVFRRGVVLSKSEKEEIRRETEKQVTPGLEAPSTSAM